MTLTPEQDTKKKDIKTPTKIDGTLFFPSGFFWVPMIKPQFPNIFPPIPLDATPPNIIPNIPKVTDPKETKPKETKPKETGPRETGPKETNPKETNPKETKPPETKKPSDVADNTKGPPLTKTPTQITSTPTKNDCTELETPTATVFKSWSPIRTGGWKTFSETRQQK